MAKGEVVDEAGQRLIPTSPYRTGAYVFYYRELDSEPHIPFNEEIIHADEHILVVDKPHFLPVIPAGKYLRETLLVRLRKQGVAEDLVPIHRLDRETAGLIMFSVNARTRGDYTGLFREKRVRKVYEALASVTDTLPLPTVRRSRIETGEPFFRMREVAGEPNAETLIELIDRPDDAVARYRLTPRTGKKHQLRIHLAALGIPIMNDRLYPELTASGDDFSQPLKLLARSISFADPVTGEQRKFESKQVLSLEE